MDLLPEHGAQRRGMLFVLSSPSGAGKTSLSRSMLEQDKNLSLSISVTTRPKRPGEEDGRDYFFVDRVKFSGMAASGALLEHAEVFGNYYGTPREVVETCLKAGTDMLFDIDWQGTQQLAAKMREDLVSVFILPPSMGELERRLRTRAQDSEEVVQQRMEKARAEISHWQEYDYVVINRDFAKTLQQISAILHAERLKRCRQPGLAGFVEGL